MKRVFGIFEVIFDITYLALVFIISFILLATPSNNQARILAGVMSVILVAGDSFHLFPRIKVILTGEEEKFRGMLGRGKQITSITMTIFYLCLWQIGLIIFQFSANSITYLVYSLVIIRILICFLPQNKWCERFPPLKWGILRNIPFFMIGMLVSILFFVNKSIVIGLEFMWLAILLSFSFYLPVVLLSNLNPKIGMLMLAKTCCYLWLLFMCLSL